MSSASFSPGKRLRELIAAPALLLMPGAYDALSARIIAAHGFEAIFAGGYAATGALLGEPDLGQMTMHDYADHYGRIAQAVDIPVFVDADTGFGGTRNVRRTVRAFERAGVAGLFIEDQTFPKRCGYLSGKTLVPVEEMIAKIKAALDARRDDAFLLAARTDALGVEGIEAAIERGRLYIEAGADMIFVQGADTIEDFRRICREVPGPQLANVSQAGGGTGLDLAALEAAGAAAVIFPSLALYAAAQAVDTVITALERDRSLHAIEARLMAHSRYDEIVGVAEEIALQERYDIQARRLAGRKAPRV